MKPAVCEICKKTHCTGAGGDWLRFKDYDSGDIESDSHPQGFEYFCETHLASAKKLVYLESSIALQQLQERYPRPAPIKKTEHKKPWFKLWFFS